MNRLAALPSSPALLALWAMTANTADIEALISEPVARINGLLTIGFSSPVDFPSSDIEALQTASDLAMVFDLTQDEADEERTPETERHFFEALFGAIERAMPIAERLEASL